MKFLAIKGFRTFQHYKTRGAPWIKLYSALLSDNDFLAMPEAAQAQLMKLWLLASQHGHPLINDRQMLAGRIVARGKFHLEAMITAGFLIPTDDPHRDALATRNEDASNLASTDASEALAESSSLARADARSRE